MVSSELSLTNHAIKSEQLVHLTNQTVGADISTMSHICGKCIETKTYLPRPLRLTTDEKLIAYEDTQYFVIGYDTQKWRKILFSNFLTVW